MLQKIMVLSLLLSLSFQDCFAEEKLTLSELNLGEYWYGKAISKADLKGKVVLFEIWGS